MPNHVVNKFLKCSNWEKLHKLIVNEKHEVDFSIIIPVPFTMDVTSGSGDVTGEEISQMTIQEEEIKKESKFGRGKNLDGIISNFLEKGFTMQKILQYYNKKHYGHTTWYEWNRNNWGSKWNAYDSVVDAKYIEFQTAWSTPEEFLKRLALYLDFTVAYADEDTGNNLGFIIAKDGDLEFIECSDMHNSFELACVIRNEEDLLEDEEFVYGTEFSEEGLKLAIEMYASYRDN